MIVVMAGLPASGKSTLCRELALRLRGSVLDKDRLRAALFAPAEVEYSSQQDDFCMRLLLEAAAYLLKKHPRRTIFLDGRPFSRRAQIAAVIAWARRQGQSWRILECVCSEETARRRLREARQSTLHPARNRSFRLYRAIRAGFEPITLPKTVIDTDQPLAASLRVALRALRPGSTGRRFSPR